MKIFVLIVFMQGWGAGVGSTGNAVAIQEFNNEESCQGARGMILREIVQRGGTRYRMPDSFFVICARK